MVGVTGYAAYQLMQERTLVSQREAELVASSGLVAPARKRLAAEYGDKQGRLLADPPSDPAQFLDPEKLVFAHEVSTESDSPEVDWAGLQAHLAKATGKEIVLQEYLNTADEVAAVKQGKIQIVALHAADTPYLVNYAGFIPVAVLGTEEGARGNRLDIAVPAGSKIRALADVLGKQLTCTRPDSITGYRAAIAVLAQETGMRPYADYSVTWSFGQSESIRGVAEGKIKVAALSDDKLKALLKKHRIEEGDVRIIYQSQVIPHLTIGHVHNLQPELAAKVVAAALEFENQQGASDEATGQPMRFYPIDYKKDFEFMRKIDDSFDPRFGRRRQPKPAAEGDEPAAPAETSPPGEAESTPAAEASTP